MNGFDRGLVVLAGLAGAGGVALAAMAAHVTGGGNLQTAAYFLLFHAPALLGAPLLARSGLARAGIARAGGAGLVVGLLLFCGDLSVRALLSAAPIPMAAPTGGMILMAGWITLALSALAGPR